MTEDKTTKLLVVLLALLLAVPLTFWNAWGFSYLWLWFITPIFGVPVPMLWQLVGLFMTVTYVVHKREPDRDGDSTQFASKIATGIMLPPITVGFGWIIKTWFGGV